MAVIRRRLADREDQFHATVFLGSGIAFVILATTAAVCAAAPTLVVHFGSEESLSDSTLALAHGLWFGLWGIGASRFVGVFMAATSTLGLRFGALPTWLARIGFALGALLGITGAFAGPLDFLFPAWLALVSITLLFSRRNRSARVTAERTQNCRSAPRSRDHCPGPRPTPERRSAAFDEDRRLEAVTPERAPDLAVGGRGTRDVWGHSGGAFRAPLRRPDREQD